MDVRDTKASVETVVLLQVDQTLHVIKVQMYYTVDNQFLGYRK